jgi:hypothetical protein
VTDDLKTKIAEAIKRAVADALHDGYDNAFANKSEWTAERGYRKGAFHDINEPMKGDYDGAGDQATKAALQAIHDAGFAIVPRAPTEAMIEAGCRLTLPAMFKHGIHGFARDGEGTRRQMAAVILDVEKKYAAMISAAQPNTEEKT